MIFDTHWPQYQLRKSYYLFSCATGFHILEWDWVNVSYIVSNMHCYSILASSNQRHSLLVNVHFLINTWKKQLH